MFQFPGFASRTYEFSTGYRKSGGLPHSEIPGSTIARISPGLIAACHVLHRLSTPRHSPDALHYLNPHPTPATGPEKVDPTDRPSRTLRGVEPRQLHWRESRQVFTTLSIPCVPIQTSGQHPALPRKHEILPDRLAVTQSKKTPYDDKQHSQARTDVRRETIVARPGLRLLTVRGALHP